MFQKLDMRKVLLIAIVCLGLTLTFLTILSLPDPFDYDIKGVMYYASEPERHAYQESYVEGHYEEGANYYYYVYMHGKSDYDGKYVEPSGNMVIEYYITTTEGTTKHERFEVDSDYCGIEFYGKYVSAKIKSERGYIDWVTYQTI